MLDAAEIRGVQVPRGGARLEFHALVVVATHDHPPRPNRLMSEQRRGLVQDDEIHAASGCGFEISDELIELSGRGDRRE